jgi:hypothetical protein
MKDPGCSVARISGIDSRHRPTLCTNRKGWATRCRVEGKDIVPETPPIQNRVALGTRGQISPTQPPINSSLGSSSPCCRGACSEGAEWLSSLTVKLHVRVPAAFGGVRGMSEPPPLCGHLPQLQICSKLCLSVGHRATIELTAILSAQSKKNTPRELGMGKMWLFVCRALRLLFAATSSKYFDVKKS